MPDSPSVPLLVLIVFGLMGEAVRRGRSARILSSSEVRACVGALIFAYAGLALHFSMPGPLQFFTSEPTTESIFRFPLALVPTVLVPCFVGLHAATLWRISTRAALRGATAGVGKARPD